MSTNAQLRKDLAAGLAGGQSAEDLAKSFQVSAAYISQLQKDSSFKSLLSLYSGETLEADALRDQKLDDIQDRVLDVISDNLETFLKSTKDAKELFKMANEAKRSVKTNLGHNAAGATVNIVLPTFLVADCEEVEHKVNENNEVIEVDGVEVITQDSKKLFEDSAERKKEKQKLLNSSAETVPDFTADF